MVYRLYVEKKAPFALEAGALLKDLRELLRLPQVEQLRILNRYDAEGLDKDTFDRCTWTVFAEPQLDDVYDALPTAYDRIFAVEYLPGQFDQRADSCAQCIQIASQGERPTVRSAQVYLINGDIDDASFEAIKNYVINPVDSHEVGLHTYETLQTVYDTPPAVPILDGFTNLKDDGLTDFSKRYALAMDLDDLRFLQHYFIAEQRDPTLTEIRMLDAYWSDHCRHTTFMTSLEDMQFEDERAAATYERYLALRKELNREHKPITLMDMATVGARYLKATGKLTNLDESEEINACTVKINVDVNGQDEPWLLLFKNETHNHPTEIEPFGGAATCIGGAIRDPLSGRGYVYQAMRITGAADPLLPVAETLPGKLPQRKIVTTAANGYSSYGNQIGLATGYVNEFYHPGYVAKRLETGAVIAAAPAKNVRRERPLDGDVVVLLGGRTGRDGCGGATGSSKSHSLESLSQCGAEVQKGNAPEERKIQRLFRNEEAARLIKRCNDFGAGGVSVAIGELADGLEIDLNAVPKKYEGLDGTELAISESQERMAVVLDKNDVERFCALADTENLEATVVARVTASPRLVMTWNDQTVVDVSREFLNSAGAPKRARVTVSKPAAPECAASSDIEQRFQAMAQNLNHCSRRGLVERFDSTVGSNTILMPFGGKYQRSPIQAMAAKLPVLYGETNTCSLMAAGFDPHLTEADPFYGGYCAVVDSVARIVASGGSIDQCYLSLQEFFARLRQEPRRWGQPTAVLLGALNGQLALEIGAIGGKDSMSGSFEDIDVPPTMIAFAVSTCSADQIISAIFAEPQKRVALIAPPKKADGLYDETTLKETYRFITEKIATKAVSAAAAVSNGGLAATIFQMCLGNKIGFQFHDEFGTSQLFEQQYGAILVITDEEDLGITIGYTSAEYVLSIGGEQIDLQALEMLYDSKLEPIFPVKTPASKTPVAKFDYRSTERRTPAIGVVKPKVLIPAFPGTNCEYDTATAFQRAGAETEIMVIRNLTTTAIAESIEIFAKQLSQAQIVFIPGGFSGGDEPDGSGKFITSFFRNPRIAEETAALLERDGLIGGICNGFQALIKLGLVPYGEIRATDVSAPTLTYNTIGRHQSRLVHTRVTSTLSPWLMHCEVGDIHLQAISHGEGRFICSKELLAELAQHGQIATQYVDDHGRPTLEIDFNPNGSAGAVESITSRDGRIFGRMAHSERTGPYLYKNVDGSKECPMFRGAVDYFKI